MAKSGEIEKDVGNVEAWAEIIEDMLYLAPPDLRAACCWNTGRLKDLRAGGGWAAGLEILRSILSA